MNLRDEIARIAYELYVSSGYIQGREFENWLEAERIVLARHAGQVPGKPQREDRLTEPVMSAEEASAAKKKIKAGPEKPAGTAKKGIRAKKETTDVKKKKTVKKEKKN